MSETQKKPKGNPVGNLRVIDHKQDKACRIAADRLEELAAQARSGEFSWRQSADAMRAVLETVAVGGRTSGVV